MITTTVRPFYKRYPAVPQFNSITRRKQARRDVRAALGTSSESAPDIIVALRAAESLRRIIDLASSGRYGLAIVRPAFTGETTQERLVEQFTFGPAPGVIYTDETKLERSSLIHEPVSDTLRREKQLKREADA